MGKIMTNTKVYCFDLDGTLCAQRHDGAYDLAVPYAEAVEEVNALYDAGNKILIFTARGVTSGKDWVEATKNQLEEWGVKHHELIMNKKPHFDILIDDKAMSAQDWRSTLKHGKVQRAIRDLRAGRPVIVVDDYNRENEGDLVLAAEMVNEDNLMFMLRHAGGLMCLPCTHETTERLELPMMPSNGLDEYGTPFTVSIDAIKGCTTGMSLGDRLKTIKVMLNENSTPDQLSYPGHMFPLRAHPGLLKARSGHTEASIELMKLCDLKEVAIIIEIMNEDGTMKKGERLDKFAREYGLELISVQEIYDAVYN